ncbi:MAG: hypothetical protein KDD35_00725, partial [Bdellovibrionales bacterium]|nr:hypothetical protein [Bdellovibrionales bacterium]
MWTFRVNFGESRFAFGRIFSFGLLLFSASLGLVTLSGCRLNDNRIRGSYGSYPSRDGTPDSFSFADKKNASLSTLYFAEIVQIGGINKKVDIAVSGDGNPEYRVCSDASCAQ